jgi:hypothetical protein
MAINSRGPKLDLPVGVRAPLARERSHCNGGRVPFAGSRRGGLESGSKSRGTGYCRNDPFGVKHVVPVKFDKGQLEFQADKLVTVPRRFLQDATRGIPSIPLLPCLPATFSEPSRCPLSSVPHQRPCWTCTRRLRCSLFPRLPVGER